jgi:formylglycine-generating enzyme required for sulfatase activity
MKRVITFSSDANSTVLDTGLTRLESETDGNVTFTTRHFGKENPAELREIIKWLNACILAHDLVHDAERQKLIEMVNLKGDYFIMGSYDGECNEKPICCVCVNDFSIGKYPVTQEQYESVMGKNPSRFKNSGKNAPVEKVSWYDAVEFCNKLSEKEGLQKCYTGSGRSIICDFSANGYRLPTEAEWEYAAKGGNKSKGYKYSGSNNVDEVAEYDGNNNKSTKPVGGKKANELGIYDMSGNVWEWCNDWYNSDYYESSPASNPTGPDSGNYRVFRGGSWNYYDRYCRSAYRGHSKPVISYSSIGFRLARSSK